MLSLNTLWSLFYTNHRVQQFNLTSSRGSHLVHLTSDHFPPVADRGEGPAHPLIFRPNWGPKGQKNFFGDRTPPPPAPLSSHGLDPTLPSVNFSQCAVHDYCYLGWMPWALYHAVSSDRSCSQQQLCLWWSCAPNIRYFHSTGNFPAISDDLVNSYHLLLCCLDLLYSNALYTKNRQNLLNPNFEGNFYIFFENKNCFPWPQAGTKCKWVISY